jgi:uncharacterized membrane protein
MTRSAQVHGQFPVQESDPRIEAYLNRLQKLLADMTPDDKEDTLCEIRAHILDSTAGVADRDAAVDRVLRLLGTPEELAARYSTERMLTHAARSFSPWVLLRTCWRWAMSGIKGTLAFLVALFGYALALGLTISVFLKPFMPSKVGMWWGPSGFNIGVPARPEQMHELIGQWFIPVMAAAACVIAVATTQALRWMIRRRTVMQVRPMRPANLASSVQI